MRMRTILAVGLLALIAGSAEAGILGGLFGGRAKRPQAVDSPMVRPKLKEDHKAGYSFRGHNAKVQRPDWGADWKRLKARQNAPRSHYLFD
jgi:hypothetical protein